MAEKRITKIKFFIQFHKDKRRFKKEKKNLIKLYDMKKKESKESDTDTFAYGMTYYKNKLHTFFIYAANTFQNYWCEAFFMDFPKDDSNSLDVLEVKKFLSSYEDDVTDDIFEASKMFNEQLSSYAGEKVIYDDDYINEFSYYLSQIVLIATVSGELYAMHTDEADSFLVNLYCLLRNDDFLSKEIFGKDVDSDESDPLDVEDVDNYKVEDEEIFARTSSSYVITTASYCHNYFENEIKRLSKGFPYSKERFDKAVKKFSRLKDNYFKLIKFFERSSFSNELKDLDGIVLLNSLFRRENIRNKRV